MKKIKYKGLLIADLHIGACNIEKQYTEIKNTIFSSIRKIQPDFIIFLGDYFDHKASLNDSISYYSFLVFQNIIEILTELNLKTKIRFVYGTESHEWNQYKIIESSQTKFDVRVIKYCCDEELFPNLNVLYVPEEFVSSKDYYRPYLENTNNYDYIFGHGIIREVMKVASIKKDSEKSTRKRVPVFSTGELLYACRGQIFFGHYHVHTNISDTVFYVGSFSRWCFGEEEPKGIYFTTLIQEKDGEKEYRSEFIENTFAASYKTFAFGYDNSIFTDEEIMSKKLNSIDKMIKSGAFTNIRFEFNIPPNAYNPESIIAFLRERYKYRTDIKVNIVNGYVDEKKKKDKSEVDAWTKVNAPLFNKSISVEDKVAYFISMEFKKNISVDRIKRYLLEPLSNILKHEESTDGDMT